MAPAGELSAAHQGRRLGGSSLLLLLAAAAGIGISAYLTASHYAAVPLACTATSVIDCASVTRSAYSVVPGTTLPIAVPGLAWFAVSALLALLAPARPGGRPARGLAAAHLLWAAAALAVVLYLVYVEIVVLHRVCEWCTGVHLLVLLSFLVAMRRLQAALEPQP